MRLIDANKLLEWRHTFASDFGRRCAEMFISAIDQEETIEIPNKWIPVSERLPGMDEYIGEIARYYLVQNEYGDMLVARYTHSDESWVQGCWVQIYQLEPIDDEIVAWMPLPKEYKVESEEV